jgi:hypothetical protein
MKPSAIVPLLALLAGFAGGWLAKPVPPATTAAPQVNGGPATRPPTPAPGPATEPGERPPPPAGARPPGIAGPIAAPPPAGPAAESRDAAKMLRFIEAIGLSESQQEDLKKILAETRDAYTASDPTQPMTAKETLDLVAKCGTQLEQALAGLLTPEQAAKFTELRQRERDNRIETKAQRELGQLSEFTDLSPTQREQILAQLRQATAAELSTIHASYTLMLDSSVLPLGPHTMPEQSILTLTQLAETPGTPDPAALHTKLIAEQRRRLDERLAWLKPILTPAQLAQYQAAAAEQRAIHDRMNPPR